MRKEYFRVRPFDRGPSWDIGCLVGLAVYIY